MRTIHKQLLTLQEQISFMATEGIVPLDVQIQNGHLCLWYETETEFAYTQYIIHIVGTGRVIPKSGLQYIATVQQDDFVWHLYLERVK